MKSTREKIDALRREMQTYGLAAYFIPSTDPHQSEYAAPRWKAREWLSGFTGSAGVVIVTADHAGLWTDSRYFLQAEEELRDSGITLHRQEVAHAPEHLDWLAQHLPPDSTLGFDGGIVSIAQARQLNQKLEGVGISLDPRYDLIGQLWLDRPAVPRSEVFAVEEGIAGLGRSAKLKQLQDFLKQHELDYYLLIALDDIAWTLNIRASDVSFNPLCVSYLLVGREGAHWFVDQERLPDSLLDQLAEDNIDIYPYGELKAVLDRLTQEAAIGIDPNLISVKLFDVLAEENTVRLASPVQKMKAVKNNVEVQHLRQTMRKDGVALLRLLRWLEETLPREKITEDQVAEKLDGFRREQGDYYGESFGAIVGYGGNGAIVHYRPQAGKAATLQAKGVLLIDSGGQYLTGTTDITRTIALGPTTEQQRRDFTLVLKGHIALSRAHFPEGTMGAQLDTLARQFLWQEGLNYGHGTGHGVGFFLNVHEGPQGFAPNPVTSRGRTAFVPGMLTSNEPGLYRTGQYGIRTENLVLCVTDRETEFGKFLRFDTLTLFPIDQRLIIADLLSAEERQWLNGYHGRVYRELSPLLKEEEKAWLREQCREV